MNPTGASLCLGGPIGRYVAPGQILSSGAAGAIDLAVDLNNIPSPTGLAPAQPFTTLYFQCWHRDSVPGGSTFSNGLGAAILP